MRSIPSASAVIELAAPAKINLHLRVGPRWADGFHPLLTWMTTIGLLDTLQFSPVDANETVMTCDDPSLPCDGRNLVMKAASALAAHASSSSAPAIGIHLRKRIPSGGGLGGGSSDAAATLVALNNIWNLGHDIPALSRLAADLGSDVPFFLHGASSVCRGRGEAVRPIACPMLAKWVVLILPEIMMPTAEVYRKFDLMGLGTEGDVSREPEWEQWCLLSSQQLLHNLVNDLEPPAFALRPDLAILRSAIEGSLDRPVRMSGSGSSLFTLFDDHAEATEAAKQITIGHAVKAVAVEISPAGYTI